jgi:sterol desaturase/sphingolipid hydroxylase (fatty acid hydroxylase superfamily)
VVERRWPAAEEATSRSRRLDALYWVVTPLLTGVLTRGAVIGLACLVVACAGGAASPATALEGLHALDPFAIASLPLWAQAPLALLAADLLSYLSHRARHAVPALRALHDVHHAPDGLTWSAAARLHPLDDLIDNTVVFFPLLLVGLEPAIVLALGPLMLLHTIYLHANWRLSLGPLDRVIATPAFHRAHHADDGPASNFGGVLSLWDHLLGSVRPHGVMRTGLPVPARLAESLRAQLITPVWRAITR